MLEHSDTSKELIFVAHSYGTVIAMEIVLKLEELNYRCKLYLIDGSPTLIKSIISKQFPIDDDLTIQFTVLSLLANQLLPLPDVLKHKVRNDHRFTPKIFYR